MRNCIFNKTLRVIVLMTYLLQSNALKNTWLRRYSNTCSFDPNVVKMYDYLIWIVNILVQLVLFCAYIGLQSTDRVYVQLTLLDWCRFFQCQQEASRHQHMNQVLFHVPICCDHGYCNYTSIVYCLYEQFLYGLIVRCNTNVNIIRNIFTLGITSGCL